MAALLAGIEWFLPERVLGDDANRLRRARTTVAFGWALIFGGLIYAGVFLWMGSPACGAALVMGAVAALGSLCVMRRTGSCLAVGNLLTAAFLATLTALMCRLGGHVADSLPWYVGAPVVALSTAGRRSAFVWLVLAALLLVAFHGLDVGGYRLPNDLNPRQYELLGLLSWIGLVSLLLSLAVVYETAISRTLAELRSAQRQLLRERDLSDSVIASLPGVFYLLDKEGRLLRWNENVEHVSGYSPDEVRGLHALDFFRGPDRDLIQRRIEEVFTKGQAETDACLVGKDGTAIPHLFSSRRVVIDGESHLLGLGIDITDLVEARQAAEAANQSKSEFLANMSHEIRTPMTAILGFSEVLLGGATDRERLDAATTIRQNGEYLLRLINDILDLSKIEAGKLEVEHVQCSPGLVLSEIVSLMRVRANAKNLPLEIQYDGPIPRTIQSDPTRLRQILINLTGNAIKFTEVGRIRLTARLLDAESDQPRMQFEVADSGIGMTAEQMAQLFNPFSQVDTSASRKHGGTGLGLAISKRLAGKLGGDITVQSTPGTGSTFTLTVRTGPLEGVTLVEGLTESHLPADSDGKPAASPARLDCRVLLAEDGLDNRRLIAFLLEKAGADVAVAENGQIACDLALAANRQETPFDVVLMDMQMPVMDGYDATRKLREAGHAGPIIALTAHAMNSDRQRCLEAGCNDYAAKPIDQEKLICLVAEYAASRQQLVPIV